MLISSHKYDAKNQTELAYGREQSLQNKSPDQTKPETHIPVEFLVALCPFPL